MPKSRKKSEKSEDGKSGSEEETPMETTEESPRKSVEKQEKRKRSKSREKSTDKDASNKSEDDSPPSPKKSKSEDQDDSQKSEDREKSVEKEVKKSKSEDKEIKKDGSEEKEDGKKKRSPDLAKFWKAVEDEPTDFTGWTYLLQFVDTTGDINDGREAYDAFLFRYPYCYGYWKKYADLEKRKGSSENCLAVFEKGIKSIPLSADLWIHYLNHVKAEFGSKPDFIRTQYERSISACGRDWRSDKLWDHYVKWETQIEKEKEVGTKNYHKVITLYERILKNPTQGLTHQFDMFKDFVKAHEPKNLLDVNDFLALRKEVLSSLKKSNDDTESKEAPGEETSENNEVNEEENTAMKEKMISTRKKIFKATEEKVQLRWKFEDAIKRPYFHMKPLERGQLKNWSEYLEFEENQCKKDQDFERLAVLFERCLIACALYEEFWTKYVNWLLRSASHGNENVDEKARDVYYRACTFHLPEKVEIHLSWAAFEEQKGQFEKAQDILKNLAGKHPELMSVNLRRINLERRAGNNEQVQILYKSCISKAKTASVKVELTVKFSRFLRLVLMDNESAKTILQNLLEETEAKNQAKIYMQLLDIELHSLPLKQSSVLEILDRAISSKSGLPSKQRLIFSQRKIEFLEDFGSKIEEIKVAKDSHEKLAEEVKKEVKEIDEKREKSIETIEGHSGKSKSKNGDSSSTTYSATANSASYTAAHASNYDQYGSRYNYGNYGQYYQQGYYPSY